MAIWVSEANFEERYSGETFQEAITVYIIQMETRVSWWKKMGIEYFAKVLNALAQLDGRIDVSVNEILDLNTCKKSGRFSAGAE
jgi:hypothetical protein